MPVSVQLMPNGYVLHYVISDPFDMQDLLKAYEQEQELRDATAHTLHSLTDFSRAHRIPQNWLKARSGPGMTHPRSGEMIFVGINPGLKVLVDFLLRMSRYNRVKLFDTTEQAHAYIDGLVERTKAAEAQRGAGRATQ